MLTDGGVVSGRLAVALGRDVGYSVGKSSVSRSVGVAGSKGLDTGSIDASGRQANNAAMHRLTRRSGRYL
jgi:hypothetical protein